MRSVTEDTIPGQARVRALVLSAAHDALVEDGYRAMSLPSVAARAGVRPEAAETVFVSKESLLVAHLDRLNRALLSLLQSIARAPEPFRNRVRELLLTRVTFRFDMMRPYTPHIDEMLEPLLLAMRRRDPVYMDAEAQILERVLEEGDRGGALGFAGPAALARKLLNATNPLLPSETTLKAMPSPGEVRRTALDLIDRLLGDILLVEPSILGQESARIDGTWLAP